MRLIQPIFAGTQTKETGLGEHNKIYNAWKEAGERIKKDIDLGVKEFLLFYIPEFKLGEKSSGWREGEGIDEHKFDQVCVTAASLSQIIQPQCRLIVDLCLCPYTPDGHCNITDNQELTDRYLKEMAKGIYNASGATIAPSDCGENTVKNIKSLKDGNIEVMSYSTKFRSSFYVGWRDTLGIKPGIHRPYQLDVETKKGDILARAVKYREDGADELLIKPGMTSIDLISDIKHFNYNTPVGVYQTSGEWLGIHTEDNLKETYQVFKRAGADFMISYGARNLINIIDE